MNENLKIKNQAIDWVIYFSNDNYSRDGTQRQQDEVRFYQWFDADRRHRQAFRAAESTWMAMGGFAPSQVDQLRQTEKTLVSRILSACQLWLNSCRHTYVRPLLSLAVVFFTAIAVLTWKPFMKNDGPYERYTTQVAQVDTFTLSDGSEVTLGARSEMLTRFVDSERYVVLKQGDAFFSVRKDRDRPFVVAAGNTEIRVIGTQFDLHRGPREVRVAVVEGAVKVSQDDSNNNLVLTKGEQVTATSSSLSLPRKLDIAEVGKWRSGYLAYDNVSLAEVVADANRYSTQPIVLSEKTLGDLRITTAYHSDQVDQLVKTLVVALPLTSVQTPMGVLLKRRAPDANLQ